MRKQIQKLFRAALLGFVIAGLLLTYSPATQAQDTKSSAKDAAPRINVVYVEGNGRRTQISDRAAAFSLGQNLGFAVFKMIRKEEPDDYAEDMMKAKALAKALGFELPATPEISGFKDAWKGRNFLVDGTKPTSVRSAMAGKVSEDSMACFDLAAELMLASTFYNPLDGTEEEDLQKRLNKFVVQKIQIATIESKFHQEGKAITASKYVTRWIENNQPLGRDYAKNFTKALTGLQDLLKAEFVAGYELPTDAIAATSQPRKTMPNEETEAEPEDTALVVDPMSPEDLEVQKLLKQFLAPGADLRKLTVSLQPTEAACNKLLEPEFAKRAFDHYIEMFKDPQIVFEPQPGQTQLKLRKTTSDKLKQGDRRFPGGYKRIRSDFRNGYPVYEWSFIEPGKTYGMRYDGLTKIDGKWFVFPKLWRAGQQDSPLSPIE